MRFAQSLGASVVVNQVGRVPEEGEGPDWQTLLAVLSDLGAYGNRVGAMLAAETGSESETALRRLLDALPEGAIGIDLNPGNLIVNGFSPLAAAQSLGHSILHVHVKDAVHDLAQGRGVEVPVGRGSADFPALLGALEEYAYRGYFTIERNQSEDPVFEIGQAVKFLRSL
jgi:sugar phosphate isomerase/epimerase